VKKVSPYNVFLKDRHASGDFKGIKSTEAIGLIANEWKSLSAGEKKVCIHVMNSGVVTDKCIEVPRQQPGEHQASCGLMPHSLPAFMEVYV
jgi:hypothetical protein